MLVYAANVKGKSCPRGIDSHVQNFVVRSLLRKLRVVEYSRKRSGKFHFAEKLAIINSAESIDIALNCYPSTAKNTLQPRYKCIVDYGRHE